MAKSSRLRRRLDYLRGLAKKKLLIDSDVKLFLVLGPDGDISEEDQKEIEARRAGRIKAYSGVSPEDWQVYKDEHVLTIELPVRACAPVPEPSLDEELPAARARRLLTPQEAPSEAEPPEYVEYELEPSVEPVVDEPEEVPEPEIVHHGRYGDQQRYADPDAPPVGNEPSVTRHGERGWESYR